MESGNTTVAPPARRPRILALTAAGDAVPRSFARLVSALRDAGAEVIPLPVPKSPPEETRESRPSFSDLKRLTRDIVSSFRGVSEPEEAWLVSQLREVAQQVDGVVAVDPAVAFAVFPTVPTVWPQAVRVAVDGDFHLEAEWARVPFDDLVVPSMVVAKDVARIREGHARIREGGPIVAPPSLAPKLLAPDRLQVVVSFAHLDPGDVDPLLFQISLARPESFELLFLPSGRAGVDELVRTRASVYGLRGKRTRPGADPEPWIRGASVLVGHPSPPEAAAAAAAKVPLLIFAPRTRLSAGDDFFIAHGAASHSEMPVTISVQLEALMPGGQDRARAETAYTELELGGVSAAARAVLDAVADGRPEPPAARSAPAEDAAPRDPDLEDIGGEPAASTATREMPLRLRRAYLREIILQQTQVERQLGRARSGLETWRRRVRLAQTAGDQPLAERAASRVDGLQRIADRLDRDVTELKAARERFASQGPLTEADLAFAARFMSPEAAARLDRGDAPESLFAQLEIQDALSALKRRITGD